MTSTWWLIGFVGIFIVTILVGFALWLGRLFEWALEHGFVDEDGQP